MKIQDTPKPLDIIVESKSPIPVYEQVKQGIKLLIIPGYLEKGDRLVPIRELAAKLRINPNTIVKVYYQLDVEGYIYSLSTLYRVRAILSGVITRPGKTKKGNCLKR